MKNFKIAVIGQGYVGFPLAIEFSFHFSVIGYDINTKRIDELMSGNDSKLEVESEKIKKSLALHEQSQGQVGYLPSSDISTLKQANIYIITVPTPIDRSNSPDLRYLKQATELVAGVLKSNDIVIYESTVYPGCTEEECVPLLEKYSNLEYNVDFFVGYSPERINPGDKNNTLVNVVKVTSGSTVEIAAEIDQLYRTIIQAGTHLAPSIKVAEAAKAIENAQRDVNISFVNELALMFDRMNIDTHEVLEAAGTKYNFLKYKPGLVGGHCISVDPYYLTYKAEQLGYVPQVILSGRRVNNMIASFISNKLIKKLVLKGNVITGSRILILGVTFKENCVDFRNSKVIDIIRDLQEFGLKVDLYDPWVDPQSFFHEHQLELINELPRSGDYDGVILAVAHDQFKNIQPRSLIKESGVIFDVKAFWDKEAVDARL
ncbi:nucleotide sugar dehydrogenase [Sphingobacterium faecium]|uniref:nucleotide sugar dehydrogenase n=1 Tax=Sphingobacterium faecium TaxID=34087 RepID=UPI00247A775B|nr:nucleotide sugar dehydrogenase [Sphingobacterium faecium]WGQ12731.1 nucleotide sugar dehydrogenase [Sphingobacterium faecium]